MTTAALARCPTCRAMVNAHWVTCLACRAPLEVEPSECGVTPSRPSDWLSQWQTLARAAGRISDDDPRYDPVLAALGACDRAYKAGDRELFSKEADLVNRLTAFVPGSVIHWRGHDKQLLGPARVSAVTYEDGHLWVCVKWSRQLYWVSDHIIERIMVDGKAAS